MERTQATPLFSAGETIKFCIFKPPSLQYDFMILFHICIMKRLLFLDLNRTSL